MRVEGQFDDARQVLLDNISREGAPAAGHVGFFAGSIEPRRDPYPAAPLSPDYVARHTRVQILGGNQADAVNVMDFPVERVLGVRRLAG